MKYQEVMVLINTGAASEFKIYHKDEGYVCEFKVDQSNSNFIWGDTKGEIKYFVDSPAWLNLIKRNITTTTNISIIIPEYKAPETL